MPLWVWIGTTITGFFVAQVKVFHKQRLENQALSERLAPTLELDFKHADRSFRESGFRRDPDYDRRDGWTALNWERYSVRITNNGGSTISNVKAEIVGIDPRPRGLPALPLRLRIRNADEHLHSGGEMYALVAYFETSQPDRISVFFDSPVPDTIPAGRYVLTIRATAKDVPQVTKKFSIHNTRERLFMCEMSQ